MTGQLTGAWVVGALLCAAMGYGWALMVLLGRRWRLPAAGFTRSWIGLVLGLGALGHGMALAGLVHGLLPGVVRGILAAGWVLAGVGLIRFARWNPRRPATDEVPPGSSLPSHPASVPRSTQGGRSGRNPGRSLRPVTPLEWICRAIAFFALLSLFPAASLPPLAYDVLEYHLEAPRLFLESGTLSGGANNFFTRLPMETELLYAAAGVLGTPTDEDNRPAKWMAVVWVALFAWGCGVVARRLGAGPLGQWGAVALGAALPLAGKVGLDAFSDGSAAIFTQLMIYGFLGLIHGDPRGRASRRRPDALLAGAGAGLALSCKWGVLPHLILPSAALVLLFQVNRVAFFQGILTGVRRAMLFGVVAFIVFFPWVLRAGVVTGNPLFPWAAGVFPSASWSAEQERFLLSTHNPLKPWEGRYWKKAWQGFSTAAPDFTLSMGGDDYEGNGGGGSGKGQWDLVLPLGALLALASVSRRRGRRALLAGLALSLLATLAWATVEQAPDRFLLPAAGLFTPLTIAGVVSLLRRRRGDEPAANAQPAGERENGAKDFQKSYESHESHRPYKTHGAQGPHARLIQYAGYAALLTLLVSVAQSEARRMALYTSGGYFAALTEPLVGEAAREEVLGRSVVALQGQAAAAMLHDGGRLLVLYEARGLLFPLPHSLNTVFDRSVLLDEIGGADSAETIDRALRENGFTNVVVNEFELDRLVRFYPPLDRKDRVPSREELTKTPFDPYPLMDLYRPYASDPRYAAKREAIRAWHAAVLKRARWRSAGATGLTLCVSPIPR